MKVKRIAAAVTGLLALWAGAATAQTTTTSVSTPLAILAVDRPQGEQLAASGVAVLSQPVASIRAARLAEPSPALLNVLFGSARSAVLPAGTLLYGVEAPEGWMYCTILTHGGWHGIADQLACMQDKDRDGRFELARPSGLPFQGIPPMVFQAGAPKPLPAPVAYAEIPYSEGPAFRFEIYWTADRPRSAKGQPLQPATAVSFGARIVAGETKVNLTGGGTRVLLDGSPKTVRIDGSEITVLGVDEAGLHYRVEQVLPNQIQRIRMQIYDADGFEIACYQCSATPTGKALVSIATQVSVDADGLASVVDYGETFAEQSVAFMPGVRLTSAPDARISRKLGQKGKTGSVGSILWRMRFETKGEAWCWRDPSGEVVGIFLTSFYCWQDPDNDGRFDRVFEVPDQGQTRLFTHYPAIDRKATPVSYEPVSAAGAAPATLSVMYRGVEGGLIGPGDRLVAGKLLFQVSVAEGQTRVVLQELRIPLDDNGQARFRTTFGHEVFIEKANAEGRVWVRARGGPPTGEIDLFDPHRPRGP